MQKVKNFINGEYVSPVKGHYLENIEPATGQVHGHLPDSDEADVSQAVASAEAAFAAWSLCPVEKRSRILLKISEIIEERLEELSQAESKDSGKPLSLARTMDIPRASANFRFFATAIQHYASQAHPMENTAINYTLRDPLGVVACISPWNLPLYLFTWKIAPALAAGNCVVAKPSEITPVTASILGEICNEAGLPPGVLNIVQGLGQKAGNAMVAHPQIKAISFTGGTKTGAHIASVAAPLFKKLSLELGGKNPVLIFKDCDYNQMLETTLRSSFANQGQICLCGSRIFVERPLYEKFRDDFIRRTQALKVGDPMDEQTQQGAVVSEAHLNKILSYINLASQEGGEILTGGKRMEIPGRCKEGYFISPAIIEKLPYDCRCNQEEIFGPVVSITPFDSEEEALHYANSVRYGLASVLWTQHLGRAARIAQKLQSGIVWVNCWLLRDLRTPFGGMKDSGVGREGGFEALNFFTESKNICIKMD